METIPITEVCRRTGLSARALRFYESRGLLDSQRSTAGQRRYGTTELARLHQITALKAAGFSLARIGALVDGRGLDLGRLIDAQLAQLDSDRASLDAASRGLKSAQAALAAGRLPDLDSFCDLIKQGAKAMTDQAAWKKVADRYYTPEEQAHWREKTGGMPVGFDQESYTASWTELTDRIEAALPVDPAGPQAQAFVAEWNALLAPFNMVADERLKAGAMKLYDRIDEWSDEVKPPFSSRVWAFIKQATASKPAPAPSA